MTQKKRRTIEINNTAKSLKLNKVEVRRLFYTLDDFRNYPVVDGTLSISFLGTENMRLVHKNFLSDDTLTDVITFPGAQEFGLAGEICVSSDYALSAAARYRTSFSEELSLYLVHGYLHLSGLDDIDEKDILKMREAERACMNFLKSMDAIPNFRVDNG